jgi:hypothetical protein
MQDLKVPVAQAEDLAVNQYGIHMLARRKGAYLRVITRRDHAQAGGMVVVAMRQDYLCHFFLPDPGAQVFNFAADRSVNSHIHQGVDILLLI